MAAILPPLLLAFARPGRASSSSTSTIPQAYGSSPERTRFRPSACAPGLRRDEPAHDADVRLEDPREVPGLGLPAG